MSRNDVILAVVCAVLVGFSLIVSLVVPRTRPDFPGRRMGLFVAVAALLVFAMLFTVERLGETEESPESEAAAETQPAQPESGPTETSGGGETSTGGGSETEGDPANGEKIFAAQGCGGCHTMEAANASGTVGPNLDDLKPPYDKVVSQVTNGGGAMPAFGDKLSPEEIKDVAAYVVASTQR